MRYRIQSREKHEYNTDPQRRCYYGVHAKSEWRWSEWTNLTSYPTQEEAEESVKGWCSIGRKTCEFRWVPEN